MDSINDIGGMAPNTRDAIQAYAASKASKEALEVQAADRHSRTTQFYKDIGVHAEGDHGSLPIATHDDAEKGLPESERSLDIGYGHKLTDEERESGEIYGISFANGLSDEDKGTILNKDMEQHAQYARAAGWDAKLKERGSSWDKLDHGFKLALTSLAYNVGGKKAGATWTSVLDAAVNKDTSAFAKNLRRLNNKKNTAGMDNRVIKEMFYSGLIKNASEVTGQLPLGNANHSGVPL